MQWYNRPPEPCMKMVRCCRLTQNVKVGRTSAYIKHRPEIRRDPSLSNPTQIQDSNPGQILTKPFQHEDHRSTGHCGHCAFPDDSESASSAIAVRVCCVLGKARSLGDAFK